MGIASAAVVAGWMALAPHTQDAGQANAARTEAEAIALKADPAGLRGKVVTTAQRIEAREAFLANMPRGRALGANPGAFAPVPNDVPDTATADAMGAGGVLPLGELMNDDAVTGQPSYAGAYPARGDATATARFRDARRLIARLGLNPERFEQNGMGGPFMEVSAGSEDGAVSWSRVQRLESALASLPSFMPVSNFHYTSGFGGRSDPFTGGGAFHPGLDMAGSYGEPVYATADGIVGRAAWAGGYGNCVDIEHGKGIATRYGHLSAMLVQPGQHVQRGQLIARMGSTGRSTGTHLHYEVRIDGHAVNPKPYLDAVNYTLAVQSRAGRMGPANSIYG